MPMSLSECRERYPGAADAVRLHEEHMGAMSWKAIIRNKTPRQAVRDMRKIADEIIPIDPDGPIASVRRQMDHADFERYVAERMSRPKKEPHRKRDENAIETPIER